MSLSGLQHKTVCTHRTHSPALQKIQGLSPGFKGRRAENWKELPASHRGNLADSEKAVKEESPHNVPKEMYTERHGISVHDFKPKE